MPVIKAKLYPFIQPWKKAISLFLLLLILLLPAYLQAQSNPDREYKLKAVFLFNFTQFVEWPPASFETGESPLVIGILGANPFGTHLEQTISGEKVNGHPVVVHYYNSEKEVSPCHILYININESKKRKEVIDALKGRAVLTVGDAPDFTKSGGMIRFFTSTNKIKLQINPEASKEGKLMLSSKLLRLAEIYNPGKTN
jgi:hypothetical protein